MEYFLAILNLKLFFVIFATLAILCFVLSVNYPNYNKPIQQEEDIKPVKATKTDLSEVRFAGKTGVALRGENNKVKQGRVKVKISEIALVDAVMIRDVDGDTAWFKCGDRKIDVRFFGVDSPESSFYHKVQPGGLEAKAYVCSLLKNGDKVKLRIVGSGNHDREAAIILKNGININELMVQKGYAWVDSNYAKRDPEWNTKLIALQENAIKNKFGIFGLPGKKIEPWVWRKQQKELMDKRKVA